MKSMFLLLLSLAAPLATASMAPPAPPADLQADLDAMVSAENAFSVTSVEKGVTPAFLAFLADDAVLMRPLPVNGKEFLAGQPSPPITLIWRPVHAEIAASGDMGYSTGPWEIRPRDPQRPTGNGHFVSVWKKQKDGAWKVVFDMGSAYPPPGAGTARLSDPAVPIRNNVKPAPAKADVSTDKAALLEQDRALSKEVGTRGVAPAYEPRLTAGVRLYREGVPPVVGAAAARQALAGYPALSWEPLGGDVSGAGDFGYTYGKIQYGDKPATYFHIWRKQGNDWKLLADVINLLPPPPPAKQG
ncbi:MAG TPA: nuclear transport factor 2 family protein [Thermoanaerobaculia bacterium]|nr:nuclear transport factor 2 family protein [Thermoanaerobaculia bacterium]